MITPADFLGRLVGTYGPRLPLEDLILQVNNLYHRFEADQYDHSHPEVHEQLPPLWAEMLEKLIRHRPDKRWRVLDFGCGTGFEAVQVLTHLGKRLRSLTCYDPAGEMLNRCRLQLGRLGGEATFWSDWQRLSQAQAPYDLIVTNSLLHHLPDPVATLTQVATMLARDAWWLSGHEPSKRFYNNVECCRHYHQYRKQLRRRNFLDARWYARRLRFCFGLDDSPASMAARAAYRSGFFSRRPPANVMAQLVDVHVPLSVEEAAAGRGFDFHELRTRFAGVWKLYWARTYSFMGPIYEAGLPDEWRTKCAHLAMHHPDDGANFCCMWNRP